MIPMIMADSYPQPTASGIGTDSQVLCEAFDKATEHILEPLNISTWRDALTALGELPSIHALPAWDGYDAEPLSQESWQAARTAFALLFTARVEAPDVMVDADGEVAFEWARPGKSVIFTFQQNGTLSYTALYNHVQEPPGTIIFTQVIPSFLLEKISRVYKNA